MAKRTTTAIKIFAAIAVGALGAAAFPASGQGLIPLPADLPCKVSGFTAQEEQQIQSYVSNALERLGSDEPSTRERARRDLLTPLRRPCVSVAFRQLFRREAIDGLTALAADADDAVAINALYVAGELAEPGAIQLLHRYTDDERIGVRYAAVKALTRAFTAVDDRTPAMNDAQIAASARHLAERLEIAQDPGTIDVVVRALLEADSISRQGFESGRAAALEAVTNGLVPKVRAAEGGDREMLENLSCLRVAQHLSRKLAAPGSVPPAACRDGAAFAGEMLGTIAHQANSGALGDNRQTAIDLTNLSERVLILAYSKLGGTPPNTGLAAILESGNDQEFLRRVQDVVLRLDSAPCNLPQPTMQRIRDALEGR